MDVKATSAETADAAVLKSAVDTRLKEVSSANHSTYERAYRRKWKKLQEQLDQEVADERERVQKRLQDEQDGERQGLKRFEEKRLYLEKRIKEKRAEMERLRSEALLMRERLSRLHPERAEDVPAALAEVARMLREVQRERESSDSRQCIACQSNARKHLFQPCRHMVLCAECSSKVQICPVCRGAIESRVDVLWA